MIEIPEAATLAHHLGDALGDARVDEVVAGHSPHKWAWFHGEPADYGPLLRGRTVAGAQSHGGFVEVDLGGATIYFAEGVVLRLSGTDEDPPAKHQLLITFADGRRLSASVRMYGGLWACPSGAFDNPYFEQARIKPSPLAPGFDRAYFDGLVGAPDVQKHSVKALLATEQRIPGLGNGVLQDILYEARLHPRRKVETLTADEQARAFEAVRVTLANMARQGGRDTEKDLFGQAGGYRTRLSRNTLGQPCARCGGTIEKAQYLGGAVYFCAGCQEL